MQLIITAQKLKQNGTSGKSARVSITPSKKRDVKAQSKEALEEDGIKMFDLDAMQHDDLRLSMPPPSQFSRKPSFHGNRESSSAESELMSNLEKSRVEYETARNQKDKDERTKQEQHLVNTIEMKETIENLNEELLVKNEVLGKFESQ